MSVVSLAAGTGINGDVLTWTAPHPASPLAASDAT